MLGDRIKKLRREKELTQAELGRRVGLSYAQIGRYENKGMQPSAEVLQKIAQELGVSTDFLLNGLQEDKTSAELRDKDLIKQFKEVEQMGDFDRLVVRRVLDALITKIKLEKMTS